MDRAAAKASLKTIVGIVEELTEAVGKAFGPVKRINIEFPDKEPAGVRAKPKKKIRVEIGVEVEQRTRDDVLNFKLSDSGGRSSDVKLLSEEGIVTIRDMIELTPEKLAKLPLSPAGAKQVLAEVKKMRAKLNRNFPEQ